MSPEIADRLATLRIQLQAEAKGHCLFSRDLCMAIVERTDSGFGSIGSTGILTETGLAYLMWRGDRALLAGKVGETAAEPAQVDAIRKFSEDLKAALGNP